MDDPLVIAAGITAIATAGTTVVSAIVLATTRYLFALVGRAPAAQNGALAAMVTTLEEMKTHNRREHREFLERFEELADVLAPRTPIGGGGGGRD